MKQGRHVDAVKKLIDQELANLTPASGSWHTQYSSSAYIYIGNLDLRLTEGDVITVFSQFGDIVDINMARDRDTGKSMGFCFLAFENQKSTILAVDNMVGYSLIGRPLRVDHIGDYRPPRRYEETTDVDGYRVRKEYVATGAEGKGIGVYNVTESQKKLSAIQSGQVKLMEKKEEMDKDEEWAKMFEKSIKSE